MATVLFSACASTLKRPALPQGTNAQCQTRFQAAPLGDVLETLQTISDLYDGKCFHEVIALGDHVRTHSRDKFYHFVNETLELVTPEGTFTEYVLESYERAYLSFLMASSYQHLARQTDAQVELRKAYLEGQALLYNYGDDPVNLVLQAALWENSHSFNDSRPLWKKVSEMAPNDLQLRKFAEKRIQEIDQGLKSTASWRIYAVGKFPDLGWSTTLVKGNGSYFAVEPQRSFPVTCSSEQSLLIPTESWAQKMSHKYDREYHPLLHLQTWTRLPVGIGVGAITALTGVSVIVAGCGVDSYLTRGYGGNHSLCHSSVEAGTSMVKETGNVTGYVLRPDLRLWKALPEAVLITRADSPHSDDCLPHQYSFRKPLNWARDEGPQNHGP